MRNDLIKEVVIEFGDTLEKLPFNFACTPTKEVFSASFIDKGRNLLHKWIGERNPEYHEERKSGDIADGQPFLLGVMRHLLKEMNDPDHAIMKELETGVTAGILHPLPRNPLMFEEQLAWRLKQDNLYLAQLQSENYKSLDEHIDEVEKKFREDEAEGMMEELSNEEYHKRYGVNVAVSSLAVLVEKDKLRVLHDGTHRTMVNHKIRCLDKLRMPGVREKHHLLRVFKEKKQVPLSILGDVMNAHRRVKILPEEHGMLGCKLREPTTWVNKVGTFGLSSAAYWWARVAGGLVRIIYGLLGRHNPLDMLLYADDLEFLGADKRERRSCVLALYFLKLLGVPMKLKKFHGGFDVDWIGLHVDYRTYSIGLSANRAGW